MEGHPLPEPGPRRRRAADPAPEPVQDRESDGARARVRGRGTRLPRRPRLRGRCGSRAATSGRCTGTSPRRSTRRYASDPSNPGSEARAPGAKVRTGRAGRRSCCAPRRAGRGRTRSTACRSRARSGPTRCRCPECGTTPQHLRSSSEWMRSYEPGGAVRRATGGWSRSSPRWRRGPTGGWAPSRTPTAGGCIAPARSAGLAGLRDRRRHRAARRASSRRPDRSASCAATSTSATRRTNFRVFCPDETDQQPPRRHLRGRATAAWSRRRSARRPGSPDGRVMEVLSRAPVPGLARGLPADRAARPVRHLRGVRHGLRLDGDPAHQVAAGRRASCTGATPVPSLNVLLTSTCWRNDHNGFSHQGPGLIDTMIPLSPAASSGSTCRRTPTACCPSPTTACAARNYVNLIVVDKQPHLQYLTPDEAAEHCARGGSVWDWAGNGGRRPGRTSCWPAPATSRRWRRSPPRDCCASTCPT